MPKTSESLKNNRHTITVKTGSQKLYIKHNIQIN